MLISSLDNNKIKEARKLLDKKYSFSKGLFIVEGIHLVEEAFKNNRLYELYVLEGESINFKFEYDNVTLKVMKSLSDLKSTPRVLGIVRMNNSDNIGNKIVLLDEVQDPGNAGTIIRNCVAFGIDTIVFSKNSVSPYNEKVVRSTQGQLFNINIIVNDLEPIIKDIKEKGINIIGTSLNASNSLKNTPKMDSYAVIFGNEGNGINSKYLDMCDKTIKISMNNLCESLNVGVSCGIILYYLYEEAL